MSRDWTIFAVSLVVILVLTAYLLSSMEFLGFLFVTVWALVVGVCGGIGVFLAANYLDEEE